jgi:uncharacterized membrane protein
MVNVFSPNDRLFVDDALKQAERKTSAKISVVVHAASSSYQAYILTYGMLLGSAVSFGLWSFHILHEYPWLLCAQLGIVATCDLLRNVSGVFVRLVPRRARDHYAFQEAMRAYHTLHARLTPEEPFALLFVSLAERYVHVVTNPAAHQRLPDNWGAVTDSFTRSIKAKGLRTSCVEAIAHISDILATQFPL